MPWDPMRELAAWQERLGRLTARDTEPWSPAIDVYETHDSYVVVAEVPGLRREQIDLSLEESRLTIRAQRSERPRATGEIVHYHQVERGHGGFTRTFKFAEKVAIEGVTADLADGVLAVTLPKQPPPPARRIEVK
jgi:HSP20 family protein